MNLGKVKSFLIVLFLGINIYLVYTTYFSSRFFVDEETISATLDILADYGIVLSESTVPKHTVNLRNIDTENIIYSEDFEEKKPKEIRINGNEFMCTVKNEGIHKASENTLRKTVISYLADSGFETRHMKFKKVGNTRLIYCNIRGYDIFDSLITLEVGTDEFSLRGSWFEPLTQQVRSRSAVRNTVYITSVLMDMTQNKRIMANAPFEITQINYGYLAGKPYGGPNVTAAALPYYQIYDNKGNIYYYDARSGTELGG